VQGFKLPAREGSGDAGASFSVARGKQTLGKKDFRWILSAPARIIAA